MDFLLLNTFFLTKIPKTLSTKVGRNISVWNLGSILLMLMKMVVDAGIEYSLIDFCKKNITKQNKNNQEKQ